MYNTHLAWGKWKGYYSASELRHGRQKVLNSKVVEEETENKFSVSLLLEDVVSKFRVNLLKFVRNS